MAVRLEVIPWQIARRTHDSGSKAVLATVAGWGIAVVLETEVAWEIVEEREIAVA